MTPLMMKNLQHAKIRNTWWKPKWIVQACLKCFYTGLQLILECVGTRFWPSPDCIPMSLLWRAEPVKMGTQQTNKQKSCSVVGHIYIYIYIYIEREREREKQSNKIRKLLRVSRVPKKSLIKLLALCTQNLVSAVQPPFLPSFHTKRNKNISLSFSLCLSQERKILGCYSLTSLSLSLQIVLSLPKPLW
jgi:hypothetical protein